MRTFSPQAPTHTYVHSHRFLLKQAHTYGSGKVGMERTESERVTGNESESKIKDENNLTKIFHLASKLCTYIMPRSFILLTLCLLPHSTHFRRPNVYTYKKKKKKKNQVADSYRCCSPQWKIRSLYCLIDSRNWYTIMVPCSSHTLFSVRFMPLFAWVDIVYLRAPYKRREKIRTNEWMKNH